MRTITKNYNIYKFDELDEESKNKVIYNYIDYLLSTIDLDTINKNSNLYKAIRQAEELKTPWFTYDYVYDYCKDKILKEIKKEEYYESGIIYREV